MKRERNDLVTFLVGIIMLIAGLYWFTSSVTVTTGFYAWRIGGLGMSGLVVVPFIVGICWIFADPDSMGAKLVTVLGIVIILASIIAGTRFIFSNRNLYEYLIMLVAICGGAALTLKVLLAKPKNQLETKRDLGAKMEDYKKLEDELEELKKKI
ncbi:hypothetical protein EDD66_102369 [Mobilisporobacter senegalensis]|uniref:Uncharacterized protein n=1 Tax=Mobilisporobacter senegalensis TaxID=1329262 RepID=A0A3N1XVQ7_9FIRM|nr:hypothetical protein [Mobilisporobacter senegalensis]ROR30714.1 hypothetical protein EDD66_102369 [Mobilisporobacter senegalensis]